MISMRLGYKKITCICGKSSSGFMTSDSSGTFICSTTCLLMYETGLHVKFESKEQKKLIDFLILRNPGKELILEIPKNRHDQNIQIRRVYIQQNLPEAAHSVLQSGTAHSSVDTGRRAVPANFEEAVQPAR
ncbi:unnamed protein product, partial [Allacma fusca]